MDIYVSRHGESLANCGRHDGPDPALSPRGLVQANRLGERLASKKFDAIYSSPTRRALATANEVAVRQAGGPAPVLLLTELAEVNFDGPFSSEPMETLLAVCPTAVRLPGPLFDGDSFPRESDGGVARAYAAAKFLLSKHAGEDEKILIVAHGIFNSRFISALLGSEQPFFFRTMSENTMLSKISWAPDRDGSIRSLLHYHNDISHLAPEGLCESRD